MIDTEYKGGLKLQSVILARMFQPAKTTQPPLFDPVIICVLAYVSILILPLATCTVFRLLTLRDFLIQLQVFFDDNTGLYLEEEREAVLRIPSMLNPSQIEDEEL
ncbi:hypothetical protein BOTBODRAFT_171326 [Botryobasidium botryosum FD-172 SS1]|uniref:Uncharacterized protein n=1 Tax=Botryobasidium botryosum (strain FD-172 SS1) TaxID=930990 RepID=A0A067N2X8_BOTB1|nr:hypothetical protein BOTBODRAFT_171326 [Botryobasidium botryosum FD-172 SS1]